MVQRSEKVDHTNWGRSKSKHPLSEVNDIAFVYWNEVENRYELKIDNKLKGYTTGDNDQELKEGKDYLAKVAKEKGYRVAYN